MDDVKLFTVEPVACYPVVLEAMGRQMYSHRSREYIDLHYDTVERLQAFLETGDDVYRARYIEEGDIDSIIEALGRVLEGLR